MSRYSVLIFLAIIPILISAQSSNPEVDEKMTIKNTIISFFEGFHKQDSMAMKKLVAEDVLLQTTGRNQEGKTQFRTDDISQLYKNIVAIPDSVQFEEKLTSWNIQVDRTMANAWVGYEFWYNGQFSHCGINSFQLVNFDGQWKIVYLIDTRGRAGCAEE